MATATTPNQLSEPVRVFDYLLRLYRLGPTEAADRIGISRATIHNWFSGKKMSPMAIKAIEQTFEIPADVELFKMDHLEAAQWLLDNKSAQFECLV